MNQSDLDAMLDELCGKVARIYIRAEINDILIKLETEMLHMETDDPVRGKMMARIFRKEFVDLVNKRFGSLSVIEDAKGGENK